MESPFKKKIIKPQFLQVPAIFENFCNILQFLQIPTTSLHKIASISHTFHHIFSFFLNIVPHEKEFFRIFLEGLHVFCCSFLNKSGPGGKRPLSTSLKNALVSDHLGFNPT